MGWGEPQGVGTTSEVDAAHRLLDGAGIPPGTLAERVFTAVESHWIVDGARITWRAAYEREADRARRAERWATLVSDLDRCEQGDVCSGASGCDGPSKGNPLVGRVDFFNRVTSVMEIPDRLVGFGPAGTPIVDPGRGERHDPEAWYQRP